MPRASPDRRSNDRKQSSRPSPLHSPRADVQVKTLEPHDGSLFVTRLHLLVTAQCASKSRYTRLDDDLPELLDVRLHDAAELLGCIAHDDETKCIEAVLHVGRAERFQRRLVHRKHDVSWRLRGREESVPV